MRVDGDSLILGDGLALDLNVSILEMARLPGRIWATGLFGDFTLLELDSAFIPVRRIIVDPPFTEEEIPVFVGRRLANRSFMAMSPQADQVVVAYQFKSRIDILAVGSETALSVDGPEPAITRFSLPEGRFRWDEGNEIAYLGVMHSGRYIYASFCGCGLDVDEIQHAQELHVFSREGESVAVIDAPRPFSAFWVDEAGERVVMVVEDPHPRLAVLRLPNL